MCLNQNTKQKIKKKLKNIIAVLLKPSYIFELTCALCTGDVKNSSEKKDNDPLKTTRALFLAWSPAINTALFPIACGYYKDTKKNKK